MNALERELKRLLEQPAEEARQPAPESAAGPAPEEAAGPAPEAAAGPAPDAAAGPAPEEAAGPAPDAAAGPAPEEAARGGCWGAGSPLFLRFRHFCHFWALLGGCWGAGSPLFLRTHHFCHFWCCWGLLGSWGLDSQNPSLLSLGGFVNLGLVANRAPLHAPQGEVTTVTTFSKQGCCRKAQTGN